MNTIAHIGWQNMKDPSTDLGTREFAIADTLHLIVKEFAVVDDYSGYSWPSSLGLSRFIFKNVDLFKGTRVLELGCGTGLPSLTLAKLGLCSLLVSTDVSLRCLESIGVSCTLSDIPRDARPIERLLDWTSARSIDTFLELHPQGFDWILGADVFYDPSLFEPLLSVLYSLFALDPSARFLTVYHERSSKRSLTHLLMKWGMVGREISWDFEDADSLFLLELTPAARWWCAAYRTMTSSRMTWRRLPRQETTNEPHSLSLEEVSDWFKSSRDMAHSKEFLSHAETSDRQEH